VVIVTRPTEYEALVAHHGTREQARFFLETHGQELAEVERRHQRVAEALQQVSRAIPAPWRRSQIGRADLSRFLFEPEDLVVAVGQDGLVANTAKYLNGQLVLGVNPDPSEYEGVLVPLAPQAVPRLLVAAAEGRVATQDRALVQATTGDGQHLLALNEVFIGHRTHQSARYRIRWAGQEEKQSSSGIIVATGTGATGWARSIARERLQKPRLPGPEDATLAFFVREAFPSTSTSTSITSGVVQRGEELRITSQMNEGGALFGDGIEDDRIELSFGLTVEVGVARERLRLVRTG
jgi:NAD kinase